MTPLTILAKTPEGRAALTERSFQGTRAQRSLLILIDGSKPLHALRPAIEALGLGDADLRHLLDAGYIGSPSIVDLPLPVEAKPTPAQAPAPVANAGGKSLAAAKFYALDMIGRLLGRADAPLRERAREVDSAEALLAWVDECTAHLKEVAGVERAELFREKTLALVPAEHLGSQGSSVAA